MGIFDKYSIFIRLCKYSCPAIALSLLCYTFIITSTHTMQTETASKFEEEFSEDQMIENIDIKTNVNGQNLELNSTIGMFDYVTQILQLSDGVSIKYDDNIEITADNIDINLVEGTAKSDGKVNGKTAFGEVQSEEGVEITKEGSHIKFKGKSSLIINDAATKNNNNSAIELEQNK